MNTQIKVARLFSFLFPLVFLLGNLGQAAVLYFGGQQIIQHTLTLGMYQKFSMYLMFILFPLGMLSIIAQLSQATSSVDTRTERQIQLALDGLLQGRTSFVTAHRLSTIRNADQVLVILDGKLVERGTHAELLAKRGAFYEPYMKQFGKENSHAAGS